MSKAAYPTIEIAAFVMFGIVYFIGCLRKKNFCMQKLQRNSDLPLMKYLDKVGLKYSTYTYRMLTFILSQSNLFKHTKESI